MIQHNLDDDAIGKTLRSALLQGMIREEDTAVIFYDLSFLEARIRRLSSSFPPNTLHGLAIKANPLAGIMEFVRGIVPNIGVEAASIGELTLALKTGYRPDQVVFDSPVKTMEDLKSALAHGVHLNIDNLSELVRVKNLIDGAALTGRPLMTGSIGLRINPQVGLGNILESSVAGEYSKFGVPVKYDPAGLEQAFLTNPWLTGVHLHVGSQGCPMHMLIEGIGVLYDFVMAINDKRNKTGFPPVSVFDIGGGLPVSYQTGTPAPCMEEYVMKISERAPELFNANSFRLITEFGRWTYTNAGWTASRVEYVKHDPSVNTAMLHVGADLFVRECLNPRDWHHEYSVFDKNGRLKSGKDDSPYNLAGPLCFSGDIIAKEISLPRIEEGDYIVIHDTGGYTFSMWSRYNSRQTPRIIGYREGSFKILKERETIEELMKFWE
jgi:diaminopimelate decarboxylase